jgi:hypothetical protein
VKEMLRKEETRRRRRKGEEGEGERNLAKR